MGATRFPECRFVSWNQPVNEKCPTCDSLLVIKRTKKGTKLVCPNKACSYERAFEEKDQEKTN
jgi:DNA topoisomerase I